MRVKDLINEVSAAKRAKQRISQARKKAKNAPAAIKNQPHKQSTQQPATLTPPVTNTNSTAPTSRMSYQPSQSPAIPNLDQGTDELGMEIEKLKNPPIENPSQMQTDQPSDQEDPEKKNVVARGISGLANIVKNSPKGIPKNYNVDLPKPKEKKLPVNKPIAAPQSVPKASGSELDQMLKNAGMMK